MQFNKYTHTPPPHTHTPYREQPRSTPKNPTTISFDQQAQISQGRTSCRNMGNCSTEVHGGGGLELAKLARESVSSRPKPCASLENAPRILPVCRSLLALKNLVIRDQFSPQKPSRPRLFFSRTTIQHSPGSSTMKLPSALAESGAYLPDRACYNTLARRPTSLSRAPNWRSVEAHRVDTTLNQPNRHHVSSNRLNRIDSLVVCVVLSSHLLWTSSSLDAPAGVTQEKGRTRFLHIPSFCLNFSREKNSAVS